MTPKMTPVVRLPPPAASSWAAWLWLALAAAALAVPIWKVKAPWTGWESAEMTRHVTTYPPGGMVAGTSAATAWPSPRGWYVLPLSMRLPPELNTRTAPSWISTSSSKCSTTVLGDFWRTASAAGSVD